MDGIKRLDPYEAAQFVGCRYDKLMMLVRAKEIPHYRIGRRVFFTEQSLKEWIELQIKINAQDALSVYRCPKCRHIVRATGLEEREAIVCPLCGVGMRLDGR